MDRPSWDEYFMNVAETVKERSTCTSRQIGAVLVKDRQIIATGYNGTPAKTTHCDEGGCERCAQRAKGNVDSGDNLSTCACCHAEENAIVQSALHGNETKGAILYTTFTPCTQCAKMIINAGIEKVVARKDYPDDLGTQLLEGAGVTLERMDA